VQREAVRAQRGPFWAAARAAGRALLRSSDSSSVIFIPPVSKCLWIPLQILQPFQIPFLSSPRLHSNNTCPVLWTLSSLVSLPMLFELSLSDGALLGTETMALLMVLHHGRESPGMS